MKKIKWKWKWKEYNVVTKLESNGRWKENDHEQEKRRGFEEYNGKEICE